MPKEYIVPGVHDLIPPEGRITAILTDIDRNKVVKEVKAENLLTNAFKASLAHGGRGDFADDNIRRYHPHLSPVLGCTDAGFTRDGPWAHFNRDGMYPGRFPFYANWFWTCAENYTPNAAHTHMPVNADGMFTGHAKTDLVHTTSSDQSTRGTIVPSQMWHKWAQSRLVVEFASTEANGVHRTVGVGKVDSSLRNSMSAVPGNPLNVLPSLRNAWHDHYSNPEAATGMEPSNGTYVHLMSVSSVSPTEIWYTDNTPILYKFDPLTGVSLTGPNSAAMVGSGRVGVVALGSDLWLSRGKTIKRCVKPTTSSLTITNTYDHTATLGSETYEDITSDGTNLYAITNVKVYVINPATGTITSSWAHGGTYIDGAKIEWDPAMGHLWIQVGTVVEANATYSPSTYEWPHVDYVTNPISRARPSATDPLSSRGWTTAGVRTPFQLHMPHGAYNVYPAGVTGMSPDGWSFFFGAYHRYGLRPYGASMASAANLGSDIVKTSAQSLKFVYDFNFT